MNCMHLLLGKNTVDVIHRTINLFAPSRYIYFFSDAPHLIKDRKTFQVDVDHTRPKITPDHIVEDEGQSGCSGVKWYYGSCTATFLH
jgi:hypothetical protein